MTQMLFVIWMKVGQFIFLQRFTFFLAHILILDGCTCTRMITSVTKLTIINIRIAITECQSRCGSNLLFGCSENSNRVGAAGRPLMLVENLTRASCRSPLQRLFSCATGCAIRHMSGCSEETVAGCRAIPSNSYERYEYYSCFED
jgi:hypothetical protein